MKHLRYQNHRPVLYGIAAALLLCGVCLAESRQDVVITKPFAKIYTALHADSAMPRLAQENERFILDHKGDKWYRVWMFDKDSIPSTVFISVNDAEVDTTGKASSTSAGFVAILVAGGVVVLFGLILGIKRAVSTKNDAFEE